MILPGWREALQCAWLATGFIVSGKSLLGIPASILLLSSKIDLQQYFA